MAIIVHSRGSSLWPLLGWSHDVLNKDIIHISGSEWVLVLSQWDSWEVCEMFFMATDVLLLCLIHIIGKVQQYYVEIMLGGAIDGIYLD